MLNEIYPNYIVAGIVASNRIAIAQNTEIYIVGRWNDVWLANHFPGLVAMVKLDN